MADVGAGYRHSHKSFRYTTCQPLVVQRHTAEKRKETHDERHTFRKVQSAQFPLEWAAVHLQKECNDKTRHGEESFRLTTEIVREKDDDGETRLPQKNQAVPANVLTCL